MVFGRELGGSSGGIVMLLGRWKVGKLEVEGREVVVFLGGGLN